MIIQRNKYLELQERQQEEELQQILEEDSPTQEPDSGILNDSTHQSTEQSMHLLSPEKIR